MSETTVKLLDQVNSREEAEQVVTALLSAYGSRTARTRLVGEARFSKQSPSEVTRRLVSNLFRGMKTRK